MKAKHARAPLMVKTDAHTRPLTTDRYHEAGDRRFRAGFELPRARGRELDAAVHAAYLDWKAGRHGA